MLVMAVILLVVAVVVVVDRAVGVAVKASHVS
jgi:hypothetical protein